MSKYTPGPWEAEPMTGRGAWVRGSSGEWAALSCGDTDATAEANARLIAAAPDLLEAVLETRKLVSEAAMTGFNFADGDWAERLFLNQGRLSAAIRKAE